MWGNLLKTLYNTSQIRSTHGIARQLCSNISKENVVHKRYVNEEEEAIKIESSLFEHSSIKYEPVTTEELLKKTKKTHGVGTEKKQNRKTSLSSTAASAFIKKTREERKSESKIIKDKDLGFEYLKLDLNDPRFSSLMISARSKRKRDKQSQIVVEGRRLILDALQSGLKLNTVIFSQKEQLIDIKEQITKALKENPRIQVYKVPHHNLKTWSTLTTPPGVMTLFERPSLNYIVNRIVQPSLPLTVVCDNIREPNNLGGIIRTCAALPCFQIIVTKGCCDPWESKALRGGCGGHFRVPIRDNIEWQDIAMTIPPEVADDCFVFIAENNWKKLKDLRIPNVVDYSMIERTGSHNVVIIGGESHGVSEIAYKFMSTVGSRGTCLNIPIAEGCDSLNVASALTLILYELRKSILKATTDSVSSPSN
ncbi:rRNA methyltransferase 3, mitochondrial [Haematobia irritans]|uniref:rRNA methyltransferase 3, mitochondrial n=1 Tax=Haematobia irritans TaxID=7368 RepID=UPI003F4FCF72